MRDAVAIFRRGIEIAERDQLPLFVFGRSLGGASAIHVLSQH
jgi:alpha-beta hydrolase superfamily lysophospholipase